MDPLLTAVVVVGFGLQLCSVFCREWHPFVYIETAPEARPDLELLFATGMLPPAFIEVGHDPAPLASIFVS